VCSPLGQLDRFAALVLQQHGQQSALRKGRRRGHNVVFSFFHERLLIRVLTVLPTDFHMDLRPMPLGGSSDLVMSIDLYEVRLRKDHRDVNLISDARPFGRLWYAEPNAISNAVGYAKFFSRSHRAVIRVCDDAGNVIETHE
jgi:hypothetical protein